MKSIFREFIATYKHFKSAYIINIIGLSAAIAIFIGIILQLAFEFGYDKFRPNADYIYQVELLESVEKKYRGYTHAPLGNRLKESCPEITDYFIASSETGSERTFIIEQKDGERKKFNERLVETIDSSIIDLLTIKVVEGDGKKTLNEPNTLLIPQSIAQKWFGNKSALQQKIIINGYIICTIGAIYEDSPPNSIFNNPCYMRFSHEVSLTNWKYPSYKTYIYTSVSNIKKLEQKINEIKIPELGQYSENLSPLRLTKLTDLYYKDTTSYKNHEEGRMTNSILLLIIGIIIITIAIINFINFNMSLAPTQIRKINTHRILGAKKNSLKIKLFSRDLISWIISFSLAIVLLQIFSSISNNFLITSIAPFNNLPIIGYTALFVLFIAIISSIYPSWYCTSFSPSLIIKGNFILTPQGKKIRNGLLGFQIFTSIFLTICTIVIISQNNFLRNYNLGFETTNIGYFQTNYYIQKSQDNFSHDIKQIPGIIDHTITNWIPGFHVSNLRSIFIEGEEVLIGRCVVDRNFSSFFNIPILKGENFSEYNPKKQVILNETALKSYPTISQNFGKEFYEWGTFIGVTKDAHCNSLLSMPMPVFFTLPEHPFDYQYIYVKMTGTNTLQTIEKLKDIYNKISPDNIFQFKFLDQTIQMQYEKEQKLADLISILSSIAFLLALIGVFSLIIFNTQHKRQEIAIRKINGATEYEIITWLNKGFIQLVIVTFLISCPIAYGVCYKWLEGFVYKTTIHWWFFAIAGISTFFFVLVIVSWKSWKASTVNPVESLRSE